MLVFDGRCCFGRWMETASIPVLKINETLFCEFDCYAYVFPCLPVFVLAWSTSLLTSTKLNTSVVCQSTLQQTELHYYLLLFHAISTELQFCDLKCSIFVPGYNYDTPTPASIRYSRNQRNTKSTQESNLHILHQAHSSISSTPVTIPFRPFGTPFRPFGTPYRP